jgi:protein-S-isoprenylcysteine O-methyltransferase Ste14
MSQSAKDLAEPQGSSSLQRTAEHPNCRTPSLHPLPETLTRAWTVARTTIVVLVLGAGVVLFYRTLTGWRGDHNVPFEKWYGSWPTVLLFVAVFSLFVFGFVRPRRRAEWGSAGIYTAFLISLFAEMFGLPLTIFLLASVLGLPPQAFGLSESHLWAYLVDRTGLLPLRVGVWLVMSLSVLLIAGGVSLLALGWHRVYAGKGALVTGGIYRFLRHPQYLGLILIIVGFNVQWPTLPTLVMGPLLIARYVWLARQEDAELEERFGVPFREYRARVPGLWPWARRPYAVAGRLEELSGLSRSPATNPTLPDGAPSALNQERGSG